jgi:hypothetical protein
MDRDMKSFKHSQIISDSGPVFGEEVIIVANFIKVPGRCTIPHVESVIRVSN